MTEGRSSTVPLRCCLFLGCVFMMNSPGTSAAPTLFYRETTSEFLLVVVGTPFAATTTTPYTLGPFWANTGAIREQKATGWFDCDWLYVVNGGSRHITAPHAEPPNASFFSYDFTIGVDDITTLVVNNWRPEVASFAHPAPPLNHFDRFAAAANVAPHWPIPPYPPMLSYVLVVRGLHGLPVPMYPWDVIMMVTDLLAENVVPPASSSAHGVAICSYDPTTSQFDLAIGISSITLDQLLDAHIHLGAVGNNGEVIVDLGPASAWESVGDVGLARSVSDSTFPSEHVSALLAGDCYLDVHTVTNPNGEIRGNLIVQGACCLRDGSCAITSSEDCLAQEGSFKGEGTTCDPNPCPIPTLSQWGLIVLTLLLLTAGTLVLIRQRRRPVAA